MEVKIIDMIIKKGRSIVYLTFLLHVTHVKSKVAQFSCASQGWEDSHEVHDNGKTPAGDTVSVQADG